MAGYKGYRLERRDGSGKALVSPLGVDVATLEYSLGDSMPFVLPFVDGLVTRSDYRSETELVKDLADQHRRLEGEDDSDDPVLTAAGAKVVITGTVNNLQVNQNALGVQITGDQLQQINEAVDNASPGTLREIVKTWIPQAVTVGAGLATLLKALGIGG